MVAAIGSTTLVVPLPSSPNTCTGTEETTCMYAPVGSTAPKSSEASREKRDPFGIVTEALPSNAPALDRASTVTDAAPGDGFCSAIPVEYAALSSGEIVEGSTASVAVRMEKIGTVCAKSGWALAPIGTPRMYE
jgi:hypothetical protein